MKKFPHFLTAPVLLFTLTLAITISLSATSLLRAADPPATAPTQEELEARFTAMLANVKLLGINAPVAGGELGETKRDTYHIIRVSRTEGEDQWQVVALMKREGQTFEVPIPVTIQWAGDTAVMILDNVKVGGGKNAYSARVLFHEGTYAGAWTGQGEDHGGVISGIIVPAE